MEGQEYVKKQDQFVKPVLVSGILSGYRVAGQRTFLKKNLIKSVSIR